MGPEIKEKHETPRKGPETPTEWNSKSVCDLPTNKTTNGQMGGVGAWDDIASKKQAVHVKNVLHCLKFLEGEIYLKVLANAMVVLRCQYRQILCHVITAIGFLTVLSCHHGICLSRRIYPLHLNPFFTSPLWRGLAGIGPFQNYQLYRCPEFLS